MTPTRRGRTQPQTLEAREVRDRQPPALPVAQLCVWLAAFCAGVLALLMLVTGESRPVPPPNAYSPDPDYLAKRCSLPRTGMITADLPACPNEFFTDDVALSPELLGELEPRAK